MFKILLSSSYQIKFSFNIRRAATFPQCIAHFYLSLMQLLKFLVALVFLVCPTLSALSFPVSVYFTRDAGHRRAKRAILLRPFAGQSMISPNTVMSTDRIQQFDSSQEQSANSDKESTYGRKIMIHLFRSLLLSLFPRDTPVSPPPHHTHGSL